MALAGGEGVTTNGCTIRYDQFHYTSELKLSPCYINAPSGEHSSRGTQLCNGLVLRTVFYLLAADLMTVQSDVLFTEL